MNEQGGIIETVTVAASRVVNWYAVAFSVAVIGAGLYIIRRFT